MTRHVPKIELLLSPGCAHAEEAVNLVQKTLAEVKVAAEVSETLIDTKKMAKELKFLGSPTIRVDGRDIEPGAEERQDYGLG